MNSSLAKGIPDHAIWVRFPRFVGDAVIHLPILRLLRQMGEGPLVVWGPASTVALVENHPLADAVLPDAGKPGPWALAKILKEHRAACSIHFPKSLRPALAAFLARVPVRVGVDESLAGPFNTHSGPFWKANGTFLSRYYAVLKQVWPDAPPMPYADYDPGLQVPGPREPYICLMPGSLWPSKAWPREHFRAVAEVAQRAGFQVVVLGAAGEREVCDFVAQSATLNLCGRTNLREAAAWLRGARGALGNDSGLSHLAAATGTVVAALYGPTDPHGPSLWGPRCLALEHTGPPCAPCFRRRCTVEGHPCLAALSPEEAWTALEKHISA